VVSQDHRRRALPVHNAHSKREASGRRRHERERGQVLPFNLQSYRDWLVWDQSPPSPGPSALHRSVRAMPRCPRILHPVRDGLHHDGRAEDFGAESGTVLEAEEAVFVLGYYHHFVPPARERPVIVGFLLASFCQARCTASGGDLTELAGRRICERAGKGRLGGGGVTKGGE
jgi:hypothetical protein